MLSHKSKYALKAMLVLSEEYGKGPLLISEIASREKIPRRFLELILLELKNQGVLRSKKGKGGWLRAKRTTTADIRWSCAQDARGTARSASLR